MRLSTSAGLCRTDTGATFPGSGGLHVYVDDCRRHRCGAVPEDAARALLARRLRLDECRCRRSVTGTLDHRPHGRRAGAAGVRRTAGGRAAAASGCGGTRRPTVVAGAMLDTLAACPPLSIVEQSRLDELKAKERERLAPEKAKARAAFVERQAKKLVARKGISEAAARQVVLRQCEGVLRPDIELPFDDEALAGCTVGDVLADPERFEGETLADPLEGVGRRPLQGEDHAPGRRYAVDPQLRARPHHLRTQARCRQRAQGDGEGGEGRRGGGLCPARRRRRHRRGRTHGVAAAGQRVVRRRAARDQRRAQGRAKAARRAAGSRPRERSMPPFDRIRVR